LLLRLLFKENLPANEPQRPSTDWRLFAHRPFVFAPHMQRARTLRFLTYGFAPVKGRSTWNKELGSAFRAYRKAVFRLDS